MVTDNQVREALKEVVDPELGVNIIDLGLVYGIDLDISKGTAHIKFTLTNPGCPVGSFIADGIYEALQQFPDIKQITVSTVWEPPWSPSMMTEGAKDTLGIF